MIPIEPVDWVRFTIRLEAMQRHADQVHPTWSPNLRATLGRVAECMANPSNHRVEMVELLDGELRLAQADPNLTRGAWREERIITLKTLLLTDAERAELQELADRLGADMAARQGLPA